MSNFTTPFASQAARRLPNADEKVNGFPCGPADQMLFNGLFWRIESELGHLIQFAGLTGSDADTTQVRQAIQALIDAATGGGETENYLLINQAAARLPIFPEFLTVDGKVNISAPATGTIRVPGNIDFLHRGIASYSTTQTDINTVANKTYHLRWNPTDGFTLKDLASGAYNPGTLADGDEAFDSTYDDMLVARVSTSGTNVATITPLANKHQLVVNKILTPTASVNAGGNGTWLHTFSDTMDWARRPSTWGFYPVTGYTSGAPTDNDYNVRGGTATEADLGGLGAQWDINRYRLSQRIMYDDANVAQMHWSARA